MLRAGDYNFFLCQRIISAVKIEFISDRSLG